jgi:peptidoglycan-associated lipoprotein
METMRLHLGRLFGIALVAAALAASGCKPSYPKCDNDDHCAEKGEVCVNGQCQECRDDTQCAEKYTEEERECVGGRCEVKPECRIDSDCDGLVCRGNKCVPECAADADCPEGFSCQEQKCVGQCENDVDCGPGRVCIDSVCQDQAADATNVSAACRPMSGGADVVALETVNFDFDKYDLTISARGALDQNAKCLEEAPGVTIVIEGHCDERGTQEYNLALGEKRANTVRGYLKNLGIDVSRMQTRSKGENEPVCNGASEDCYAQNRRVQFLQER